MKKILMVFTFLTILLSVLTVSAEYGSYFDVIKDAKKLIANPPEKTWEQSYDDVMAIVNTFEGYSCQDKDDTVVCNKEHWSGSYEFTLYFDEGKFDAVDILFTSDTIKSLNYTADSKDVVPLNDLFYRISFEEFGSWDTPNAGASFSGRVFPNNETVVFGYDDEYSSVVTDYFYDSILVETGFRPVTETNPSFSLELIFASFRFYKKTGNIPANQAHYYNADSGETYYRLEEYDSEGNWKTSFFNENGERTIVPDLGYASTIQKDTDSGAIISYHDLEGNPVETTKGYASIVYTDNWQTKTYYDLEGNEVEIQKPEK